ncbi:family 43 glycosylhydrolase [Echinicola jeungdonensis]|uniref:Family 43 glycosylhydrolase n=1 Tax=Echinicola jeungdonensis TaxID=709343 RepID=A0ABV5J9H2_9BACT|nr:family 43 glycosylhydrolase [Echinicola jeungdonensis]MDN3670444.1 family 43 glycosylhydrolase [Echinicola jeungdonensis]
MNKSKVLVMISACALLAGVTGCQKRNVKGEQSEKSEITAELISNPISEISCADPSIVKHEGRFYIFATVDPWGGEELVVLESSDFKNWERKHIQWPNLEDCTSPTSGKDKVWAPGVIKGKDGKFYMYVTVHNELWAGVADHPLGPWKNAKADGTPLIKGDMFPEYHMIDGDAFIDDDGQVYLYWGSGLNWVNGHCFVVKLKDDMASFNEEDIKDVTPPNYFEAPYMIKRDGKYFLMYSHGKCTNGTYQVRYSVGDTPYGPWTEGTESPILTTTEDSTTLGPGHHTVFSENGQDYILYHRIRDNSGPLLRELVIDSLNFDIEGNIKKVIPRGAANFAL